MKTEKLRNGGSSLVSHKKSSISVAFSIHSLCYCDEDKYNFLLISCLINMNSKLKIDIISP